MSTTPDPADASTASAALGATFTELMPGLLRDAAPGAELVLKRVREETCLKPESAEPQTRTSWIGWAEGTVTDPAAAMTALDALDARLTGEGWDKKNETGPVAGDALGDVRTLYFSKGELGLTAGLQRSTAQETLDIKLTSPCTDQPSDHRMQRSELDPDYGTSSRYYDDGS